MRKYSLQSVVNALVLSGGNKAAAADFLGMRVSTFKDALRRALAEGITPSVSPPDSEAELARLKLEYETRIKELSQKLKEQALERISAEEIRQFFFDLPEHPLAPPQWTLEGKTKEPVQGIPTLMLSDLHWGEVVQPDQVNGLNEYNLEIAQTRLRNTILNTIDLCFNHLRSRQYPGIVLALGGDLFSGEIHDELAQTNEKPTMVLLFDLFDQLVAAINTLREAFGRVFVVCTYGNHGRTTIHNNFKDAAFNNFDWVLCNMLERHFKMSGEKNVQFLIPNSFDTLYRVYDTTYLLTHGDRLGTGGGGGLIGIIGPVIRGSHKVLDQYAQMGINIDKMLIGHFHQYLPGLPNVLVNGSLKGYDEYAMGNRFTPEAPQQALWITHHERGITHHVPVFAEGTNRTEPQKEWVSWAA